MNPLRQAIYDGIDDYFGDYDALLDSLLARAKESIEMGDGLDDVGINFTVDELDLSGADEYISERVAVLTDSFKIEVTVTL